MILTVYSNIRYIIDLLEVGVCGYLLKTARSDVIVRTIRGVHSGDSVLDLVVTQKLAQRLIGVEVGGNKLGRKE